MFFYYNIFLYCFLGEVYLRDFSAIEIWGNCVGIIWGYELVKESGYV